MGYLEALGLLILLGGAALAILPLFKLRRYLGVLLSATAIGAFVIGYGFGSRDALEHLRPFLQQDKTANAMLAVKPYVGSPLLGVGVGLFLMLLAVLVFWGDIRVFRNERNRSDFDGSRPNN